MSIYNISDSQKAYLRGLQYEREKKRVSNSSGINQHTKEDSGENYHQPKTAEQKAREGMALEKVVAERAERRMLLGVKIDPVDEPSTGVEKGKTRDEVAKKVGFKSGRQYERII